MLGGIYVLSDGLWLRDRARRLSRDRDFERQPYHKQELILEKRRVQWQKRLEAGEVIKPNPLPSGIEVQAKGKLLAVCACLPEGATNRQYHLANHGIQISHKIDSFDRSVMADIVEIRSKNHKLAAICALDFLDRLLNLRCWNSDEIPLTLNGFARPEAFWAHVDRSINAGDWDFESRLQSVCDRPTTAEVDLCARLRFGREPGAEARTATIRHEFTPYDYLWQTGRGGAQYWADWASVTYSELFGC